MSASQEPSRLLLTIVMVLVALLAEVWLSVASKGTRLDTRLGADTASDTD